MAGQDIMVRRTTRTIKGPDALAGKKVCSVDGLDPGQEHPEYVKDPPGQLVLFDVYSKCVDALKNNQVDAVTTDNVILLGWSPGRRRRSSWSASPSPRSPTASA